MRLEEAILEAKVCCYQKALKQGKVISVIVTGNSMLPFLKNGETVEVNPAKIKDVGIGDIVLHYAHKRLFCHRVFRKGPGFFQTKADALIRPDPPASEEALLGKVIAKGRKGRMHAMPGPLVGWMISRICVVTAWGYPPVRWLRRCCAHIGIFNLRLMKKNRANREIRL